MKEARSRSQEASSHVTELQHGWSSLGCCQPRGVGTNWCASTQSAASILPKSMGKRRKYWQQQTASGTQQCRGSGQIRGVPGCPRAHRLPPCGACPRSSLGCCPPETARTDHLLGDGQKNRAALPHPKPGARGCCSLARPQRLEEAVLSVSHDCMIPWVTVLEERGNVNSLMEFPISDFDRDFDARHEAAIWSDK